MTARRFIVLLALAASALSPAIAERDQAAQDAAARAHSPLAGWNALSILQPRDALERFAEHPGDPEARFGEAMAFLALQPKSRLNVERAGSLLRSLAESDPQSDLAVSARYHLARIAHIHAYEPNVEDAARQYEALLADYPSHPAAEQAAPKLAIVWLYADVDDATWDARLARLEALAPRLSSNAARRDLRLALAEAILRLRQDHARALEHLWPVLRDGVISRSSRATEIWLQAAESSAILGRPADAALAYRRFLELAPRDVRASEVRRRLASVGGSAP